MSLKAHDDNHSPGSAGTPLTDSHISVPLSRVAYFNGKH